MKKFNPEYALYKTLKNKDESEIYYTILSMVNKTYTYEIKELNNVPYDELMIYLEKIIIIGSKCSKFDTAEDLIKAILMYAKHKDEIRYHHLRENTLLNIKYSSKIMALRIKNKRNVVKIASLFLTAILLMNLYGKVLKANNDPINTNYIGVEIQDDEVSNIENVVAYNFNDEIKPEEEIVITKEPTNEEKLAMILENYNLTEEEFNVVCAIAMTESKTDSYDDTYCVINTIYNRTLSKLWHIDTEKIFGEGSGYSLFYQAISPTQFVVYEEGRYLQYLGVREGPCFQAVIDFLYTKNIKHDYLSFRASNCEVSGSVQFVPNGNKYFNPLQLEDRISNTKSR